MKCVCVLMPKRTAIRFVATVVGGTLLVETLRKSDGSTRVWSLQVLACKSCSGLIYGLSLFAHRNPPRSDL